MKPRLYPIIIYISAFVLSCTSASHHDEMIALLKHTEKEVFNPDNPFSSKAKLLFADSILRRDRIDMKENLSIEHFRANTLLELGEEEQAVEIYERLLKARPGNIKVLRDLGIAYMRIGERTNCFTGHAAESCILPIKGLGIHKAATGSEKAIEVYAQILELNERDMESRWLMNLAYMTLGKYPDHVPQKYLIPGMGGDSTVRVNAFVDVATDLKLDLNTMAGGTITDDMDNDGYIDLVISSMYLTDQIHFFRNNGDGSFTNLTEAAGLKKITGGLNIAQADYNNDGFKDILILRGGWQGAFGNEPNSLLKNNGDGTFSDVTKEAGLLSFHPTQTATWNDFNNDGWVDLFIGNESMPGIAQAHPCELFINNQDGTFSEIARLARCDIRSYVKGVTSGDYDNDGWKDLFLSTMSGQRILLQNRGIEGDHVVFKDATMRAGLRDGIGNSFPTWFWDFDNDGWLDIFACDYTFSTSLGAYVASEKLGIPFGNPEKTLMYRNNHDGTFTNVARELGMNTNVFAMGSNFGDIDNDGFLDMYLGSGNPDFRSLIPNRMFKNQGGKTFADVTASARVGHLQKGHGVSFADMDNDGDQDIYTEMGGAYAGDAYQNAFFLNPGQGNNNWICIDLEGVSANKAAIGSRLIIHITENGVQRKIYRDVNSGGSFGSSPLRREIGIGQATKIDLLEIQWHGSNTIQKFENISANQFLKIVEGDSNYRRLTQKKITWTLPDKLCGPLSGL